MVVAMAVKDSREVIIEATPEEILDVIADVESAPSWSPQYQKSEVLETYDDGRPKRVKMKIKAAGLTDDQEVEYSWGDNTAGWTLIKAGQLRSQDATYTLTPERQHQGPIRSGGRPLGPDSGLSAQTDPEGGDGDRHGRAAQAGTQDQERRLGQLGHDQRAETVDRLVEGVIALAEREPHQVVPVTCGSVRIAECRHRDRGHPCPERQLLAECGAVIEPQRSRVRTQKVGAGAVVHREAEAGQCGGKTFPLGLQRFS